MTNDEFLDRLRSEWAGGTVDLERMRVANARRRRRAAVRLAADIAGAALAVIAAVWFALTALRTGEALFWLGAAAMLLVPPSLATKWLRAWRDAHADYGATPLGVIHQARAHVRAELRLVRGGYHSVVILLLCAVVAWVLQLLSFETWRETAWLSAIWATVAVATWLRLRARARRLRAELDSYERRIQEFGGEDA
jgi:hypothetical protein